MSEKVIGDPSLLPADESFPNPDGPASQETILRIVTEVDELTLDGVQGVTNRSKFIINDSHGAQIALRSFGLPEGLQLSKETKAELKRNPRIAGISTFENIDIQGIGPVRVENRYDIIIENLGGKTLKIVQHFEPEVGPAWSADISEDEVENLAEYIKKFKPVPPQGD